MLLISLRKFLTSLVLHFVRDFFNKQTIAHFNLINNKIDSFYLKKGKQMPKLLRRTTASKRYGRQGAISAPLPARSGTDGTFAGTFAAPSVNFNSATAAFVASDVGRIIRVTGTVNGRYDWAYKINSVVSSTQVTLRYNHNIVGLSPSPARFMENGTAIAWKILESATFTMDAVNDAEPEIAGSQIKIESSNPNNKGVWFVSERINSQSVLICKSYIWFATDFTPYTTYSIEQPVNFVAETGLEWKTVDRQGSNPCDAYIIRIQFLIDAGFAFWQNRGSNATLSCIQDIVLRSTGETDPLAPGGKIYYVRAPMQMTRTGAQTSSLNGFFPGPIALYQHWDHTLTAGGSPGQGSGGVKGSNAGSSIAGASGGAAPLGAAIWNPPFTGPNTALDFNRRGRNDLPDSSVFYDYTYFADKDEAYILEWGVGGHIAPGNFMSVHFGLMAPISAGNPNIVTATNTITAGANRDINVGTINLQTLSPPYSIGDNITLVGRKTSSPAEYVETTTIVSFDNTDTNNRLVRVANASMAFGNGPDTIKFQIGEDPLPLFNYERTTIISAGIPYLQNASKFANATVVNGSAGRDCDLLNFGHLASQTDTSGVVFTALSPNRKSGKQGVKGVQIINNANTETRGRMRNISVTYGGKYTLNTTFIVNGVDVYLVLFTNDSVNALLIGPMTKALAGIR